MNNQQAQLIVNERVRPLAEKLRAIQAELGSVLTDLSGEAATFFDVAGSGAGSEYQDLRTESVPLLLTAADVVDIRSRVITLANAMGAAGFMDSINRACVRPLRVE